jgi:hypothetical protein
LRNLDLDELTLNLLGPALRALSDADLSRMLRSQPVCLLCDDGSMLPVMTRSTPRSRTWSRRRSSISGAVPTAGCCAI